MTENYLRQLIAEGKSLAVEFKVEQACFMSDDELVTSTTATYC